MKTEDNIDFDIQWKNIGMYDVSSDGQVFSHYTNKVLKPSINNKGYKQLKLAGSRKRLVHHIVWETFCGEIPEKMVIDHLDGNPLNNRLDNLRCVTQYDNIHNNVTYQRFKEGMKNFDMKKLCSSDEWKKKNAEAIMKAIAKPVHQIDEQTGEIIKTWDSITNACVGLGIKNTGNITRCCRGERKTACGFKWAYKKLENNFIV